MDAQTQSRLNEAVAAVASKWAYLSGMPYQVINTGYDHILFEYSNKLMFRVPRKTNEVAAFWQEIGLLRNLSSQLDYNGTILVPHYAYIESTTPVGGYEKLQGEPLTSDVFNSLHSLTKKDIAREMGQFLSTLHGMDTSLMNPAIPTWTCAGVVNYSNRYSNDIRSIIVPFLDAKLVYKIDQLYVELIEHCSNWNQKCVIHGDLSENHLLFNQAQNSLTYQIGIIDFGDSCLGDAAFDFTTFWQYGPEFLQTCLKHYSLNKEGILKRSHYFYKRWLVEDIAKKIVAKKDFSVRLQQLKDAFGLVLTQN